MFSKIFSRKKGGGNDRPPLEHPKDLRVGDLFEMGLSPISELNNKTFKVIEANTLDYGEGLETAFIITAEGQKYGLYLSSDDEGESLQFSKLIKRSDVAKIFGLEVFGDIFEEGTSWNSPVNDVPSALEDWIDMQGYYKSTDALKAYFEKGDHRFDLNKSRAEEFDYYDLKGSGGAFSIEVEVYDGDETEVFACRNLPLHSIDKLWPTDS